MVSGEMWNLLYRESSTFSRKAKTNDWAKYLNTLTLFHKIMHFTVFLKKCGIYIGKILHFQGNPKNHKKKFSSSLPSMYM